MQQPDLPNAPAILLIAKRAGLRERLAGKRVVDMDEAALLDTAGRGAIRVVLMSSLDRFSAGDMDLYPNLGMIVTVGAGAERVDAGAAAARGIAIATGAGVNAEDVADMALGLFIAAGRRVLSGDASVREGGWQPGRLHMSRSLSTRNVGIMGMGAIGQAIARRLIGFRVEIAWSGPNPKPEVGHPYYPTLAGLADWADTLIVAAPLNAATAGVVDRAILDALGPHGIVVNVGRGGIVDEDALVAALREGTLAAAALDVFAQEPTPPEKWADVPNLTLSPHAASATPEAIEGVIAHAARKAAEFIS